MRLLGPVAHFPLELELPVLPAQPLQLLSLVGGQAVGSTADTTLAWSRSKAEGRVIDLSGALDPAPPLLKTISVVEPLPFGALVAEPGEDEVRPEVRPSHGQAGGSSAA